MLTFAEFFCEKYNKSETKLMAIAQSSPDHTVTVTTTVHNGKFRNVREKNAFHKLLVKGHLSQSEIEAPHRVDYSQNSTGKLKVFHAFTAKLAQPRDPASPAINPN